MSDSEGSPLLGLLGIGDDNPVPARVDLEEDLNLEALVDRLELGGVLLFGQLIVLGLFTTLPLSVKVGIAGTVVIVLDVFDRKVVGHYLD